MAIITSKVYKTTQLLLCSICLLLSKSKCNQQKNKYGSIGKQTVMLQLSPTLQIANSLNKIGANIFTANVYLSLNSSQILLAASSIITYFFHRKRNNRLCVT